MTIKTILFYSMLCVTYHDGVAGAGGEEDVLMAGGDASVPLLDVAGHVLPDAFDTLAGTVGT